MNSVESILKDKLVLGDTFTRADGTVLEVIEKYERTERDRTSESNVKHDVSAIVRNRISDFGESWKTCPTCAANLMSEIVRDVDKLPSNKFAINHVATQLRSNGAVV